MAIHRRPPANTIIGAFADSACKTCNAMIPEVAMQPSTKIKPTCTKRCQGVTEFSIVFMLNQTEQLQNRHAAYKQPNDRTQPRRAGDANRESGIEGANRRWLQ